MDIPILPSLNVNADTNDSSCADESINSPNMHVSTGDNSTIIANSGNERGRNGKFSRIFHTINILWLAFFAICAFNTYMLGTYKEKIDNYKDKVEQQTIDAKAYHTEFQAKISSIVKDTSTAIEEMKALTSKTVDESKEGTIWILRRDILNSIELYDSTKSVTSKEYKRLKDQFNYYKSIGGNHDVESRFEDFTTKIFGTAEIKMSK